MPPPPPPPPEGQEEEQQEHNNDDEDDDENNDDNNNKCCGVYCFRLVDCLSYVSFVQFFYFILWQAAMVRTTERIVVAGGISLSLYGLGLVWLHKRKRRRRGDGDHHYQRTVLLAVHVAILIYVDFYVPIGVFLLLNALCRHHDGPLVGYVASCVVVLAWILLACISRGILLRDHDYLSREEDGHDDTAAAARRCCYMCRPRPLDQIVRRGIEHGDVRYKWIPKVHAVFLLGFTVFFGTIVAQAHWKISLVITLSAAFLGMLNHCHVDPWLRSSCGTRFVPRWGNAVAPLPPPRGRR